MVSLGYWDGSMAKECMKTVYLHHISSHRVQEVGEGFSVNQWRRYLKTWD